MRDLPNNRAEVTRTGPLSVIFKKRKSVEVEGA